MLKYHFIISLLASLTLSIAPVSAQDPIRYINFDEGDSRQLPKDNGKCKFSLVPSAVGKGLMMGDFENGACIYETDVFSGSKKIRQFSLEFLVKGDRFQFASYPQLNFRVGFDYDRIYFNTAGMKGGKPVKDGWIVNLRGTGISSYDYLADNQWHHVLFRADAAAGKKEIWIDGQTLPILTRKMEPADYFMFDNSDGFRSFRFLDEAAFYDRWIGNNKIADHALVVNSGKHYSFASAPGASANGKNNVKTINRQSKAEIDTLEYAPGYPDYTTQATDQLKAFPLPRFGRFFSMPRNFPWTAINYLHRELPGPGGKGFGKVNPVRAVELTEEMAENWNYYIELICEHRDSAASARIYSNPASVQGALIRYANQHPELPAATIMLESQVHPVHAGFDRKQNFISAQDLPDEYYFRDKNGKPIIFQRRKWINPEKGPELSQKDGITAALYIRNLRGFLSRPLNIINENGEVFGHMRPDALLKGDPRTNAQMKKWGLNNAQYSGWFQDRLDSTYRETILKAPGLQHTLFTFYNVSAINNEYWPDYAFRRKVNTPINGRYYPTPDLYPRYPWNWRRGAGPWNGLGVIAEGRRTEIALGDTLFSPYVSAGWNEEENNVRPAQWLGLLKAMTMLGADFFYTGYFNVTGSGGKWPNGAGPYDPRGYMYQVAMPVYAQALASRYKEFLLKGKLLNPASPGDRVNQFRFPTERANQVVMVRQLGNDYLIYGTLQPNSNLFGATPLEDTVSIELNGHRLRFQIRRQGSTYWYHVAPGQKPIWVFLDGWHQYEHPYFWTKDFRFEAECSDNKPLLNIANRVTESNAGDPYDFRKVTSFYVLKKGDKLEFDFASRNDRRLYCYLRARTQNGSAKASIIITNKEEKASGEVTIKGTAWQWYRVLLPNSERAFFLNAKSDLANMLCVQSSESLEVDKVLLADDEKTPTNE